MLSHLHRHNAAELATAFNTFESEARSRTEAEFLSGVDAESVPRSPSLTTVLPGGNADPFDATPVPLTAWNYGVLAYIRPFTLLTVWPVEMADPRGKAIVSPGHKQIYKNYVSHPSIMHAMLAYSWGVLSLLQPIKKEEYLRNATEHILRAMRALRPIIGALSSESNMIDLTCALQTVQTLTSAETYRNNREAAFQHRSALARIIELMGGCRNVPWILRSSICYLMVRVAANTGTRTDVDPVDWDPGPWATQNIRLEETLSFEWPTQSTSSVAPTSAGNPSTITITKLDGILPTHLASLRELVFVAALLKSSSSYVSDADFLATMQWSHSRRQAIRGHIGNYWYDITSTARAVAPQLSAFHTPTTVYFASVDMCLCLSMLIFLSYGLESPMVRAQHWIPSVQVHHLMLLRCVRRLGFGLEAVEEDAPAARDLLWVCAVGVHVEEEYSLWKRSAKKPPAFLDSIDPDEFDVRWFSIRFGIVARRLGFQNLEDVISVFKAEYAYMEIYDVVLRRAFDLV